MRPVIVLVATLLWPFAWATFGAGFALVVSGPHVPHVGVWPQALLCAGAIGIAATINTAARVATFVARRGG